MKLIIDWCEHHKDDQIPEAGQDSEDEEENSDFTGIDIEKKFGLQPWDEKFLQIDQTMLMELILAADFMRIAALLKMCCQVVASMLPGKTPDQLRKLFNIKNDFTAEEEEQMRRENPWCQDQ